MDITAVDRSAVLGDTLLHRAAARTKLVASAMLVAAIVLVNDPLVALGVMLSLTGAAAAVRLPLRRMLPLAGYAAGLALVFAVASAPGPVTGALYVLKAITTAFTVVALMFSTPYPQVFAPVQHLMPTIVGDTLLMTYRSLFLLAEKFGDLLRAVRLRSGLSRRQPVRAALATTRALGGLLLYSLDLSQREYDILRLRGYERGLRVAPRRSREPAADAAAIAYATLVLGVVVVFSLRPSLAAYAWLVTAAGLLDLAIGLAIGWRRP